jgi:hypothetical protein
MILLAVWLIVSGLAAILSLPVPQYVLPVVAVIAGVLILLGE